MKNLILENLTIGYEEPLIENINLQVTPGKMIALLGSNGSGKSTLIKTLLKIIEPLHGEILYEGRNIGQYAMREWSHIFAAVFSSLPYTPMIRVHELIQIGNNKIDQGIVDEVVQQLNISSLLNKYANEISDGQLQKVMIARALIQNTPYIIFDEPTAHLDFRNKREVFVLLKDLINTTQKTFIVITHEVLQALALSDEMWYLDQKKLHQDSPLNIDHKFGLKEEILKINHHVRN